VASAPHDAKSRFRKLRGHKDMKVLMAALNLHAEKLQAGVLRASNLPRSIRKPEQQTDQHSSGIEASPQLMKNSASGSGRSLQ